MIDKINGRTPEEIKADLIPCKDRSKCKYCLGAFQCEREERALIYIQQLEAERDAAVKALEFLAAYHGFCDYCKHLLTGDVCIDEHRDERVRCWEWDGVQKGEG